MNLPQFLLHSIFGPLWLDSLMYLFLICGIGQCNKSTRLALWLLERNSDGVFSFNDFSLQVKQMHIFFNLWNK